MFPCFLYRIAVRQRNKRIYKTDWHLIRHGLSVTDQVSHKHSHIAFGYVLYTPYRHPKLKIQTALGASYLPQGRLRSAERLSRTLLFKSVRQSGIQGISLGFRCLMFFKPRLEKHQTLRERVKRANLFSLVRFFGKDQRNEQSTYIKSSLCVDEQTNIHPNRLTLFFFDTAGAKKKRLCKKRNAVLQGRCPCTPQTFEKVWSKLSERTRIKAKPDLKFFGLPFFQER